MKKLLKKITLKAFAWIQETIGVFFGTKRILFLINDTIPISKLDELKKRLNFYSSYVYNFDHNVSIVSKITFLDFLSNYPIFICDSSLIKNNIFFKLRSGSVFKIDYDSFPNDGWEWHRYIEYCNLNNNYKNKEHAKFIEIIKNIKKEDLVKSYIFGTGSSLDLVAKRNWSDGYRIVANTIVKSKESWLHIKPHFIVAGDAIYHFGHTEFAFSFRSDLKKRLKEYPSYFVYPKLFDSFVKKEFCEFEELLIPIPIGEIKNIHYGIDKHYGLAPFGNVLLLMLLPLACTLSKNVFLWGFDGRSPNDKLFWKNSDMHFYESSVPVLKSAHPAFFSHYVPSGNESKYVKTVHGDTLEELLVLAEKDGFEFESLHFSYTDSINKRYKGN